MFRKILECLLFGLGNSERDNAITWTLKPEIFQALLLTKCVNYNSVFLSCYVNKQGENTSTYLKDLFG